MINETLVATAQPDRTRSLAETRSSGHAAGETILSWLAFAAVVLGVVGAIGGSITSARRRASSWRARGDRYELTPPHGDKLHPEF